MLWATETLRPLGPDVWQKILMASNIKDVFRMEPVLVRLQGIHTEFATLDLARFFGQRPVAEIAKEDA